MNYLKLIREELDVNLVNDLVADSACGAISIFVGTTRDNFEDKKVLSLEYEAYEPMALKVMENICEEMRSTWSDIKHIAIYHRLGLVPVKKASVIIAVSSPHRQTSLLGVQFAIDKLKQSVPIWKKEQYEDNSAAWKENKESVDHLNVKSFKRRKLNLESCTFDGVAVPRKLIQIAADETELNRRINCFIEKKREEIDLNNILDFIPIKSDKLNESGSCARVNSIVIKQKDSKGHVKVQRVKNEIGPQIKEDYSNALDRLTGTAQRKPTIKQEPSIPSNSLPPGIAERLENTEQHLNINANYSKDIYARLKAIEDRILFLETISPEYYHFLNPGKIDVPKKLTKRTYSINDLDIYIDQMKANITRNAISS